ncbi:MAG: thermonuclease family protein [Brevundimonas sp.]|nr:thermonuclease family protein [Brevundimonas sp.]
MILVAPDPPAIIGRASVIDGDTLDMQGQRIRLWAVDAPEGRQTCDRAGVTYRCGQEAANALDRYIGGRPVRCAERDRDRYRRIVARCSVGGRDLGGWLVREGLAVRYPEYAGRSYMVEEAAARVARRGIWAGTFVRPWDWRRGER